MINKTLIQGLVILVLFFGMWFGLSQINFVKLFHVKEIQSKSASKLGDLIWEEIEATEDVIYNDTLIKTLDKIILPICENNDIERDSLKIHLVDKDEVNAFALPNNHLVIYTGLILDCKKQEALQGVSGHEIAHIQKNHVMKKLSKEIGLSVLLSATTGGKGGEIIKQIFKTLSSSAYDRTLEKEADITSVEYLLNADVNPEPMADFMYQLAMEHETPSALEWISTHPDSEERAKYILNYIKGKKNKKTQTLTAKEWNEFKEKIKVY